MRLYQLLRAKLHHARVTYANPDYVGSIEIDRELMERVGFMDGEVVQVWAVDHKARIETYAFSGPPGTIGLNGGAAQFFKPGERIIVAAFAFTDEPIKPKVLLLDEQNRVIKELVPFKVLGE